MLFVHNRFNVGHLLEDLCRDAAMGKWPHNKRRLYAIIELLDVVEANLNAQGLYLFTYLRNHCGIDDISLVRQLIKFKTHGLQKLYKAPIVYNIFCLNNDIMGYIYTFCDVTQQQTISATCMAQNTHNWYYQLLLSKFYKYPNVIDLCAIYGLPSVLFVALTIPTVSLNDIQKLFTRVTQPPDDAPSMKRVTEPFTRIFTPIVIQTIVKYLHIADILHLILLNRYWWLNITNANVLRGLKQFKSLQVIKKQSSVFDLNSSFFLFTDSKYVKIIVGEGPIPNLTSSNIIVYESNYQYVQQWGSNIAAIHRIVHQDLDVQENEHCWDFTSIPETGVKLYIHSNDDNLSVLKLPAKCKVVIWINTNINEKYIRDYLLNEHTECIAIYNCQPLFQVPTRKENDIHRCTKYKTLIIMQDKIDWWEMYHLFDYGRLFDKSIQNFKLKCKLKHVSKSCWKFWNCIARSEWGPPKSIVQLFDGNGTENALMVEIIYNYIYQWILSMFPIVYHNQMIKEFTFILLIDNAACEFDVKLFGTNKDVLNSLNQFMGGGVSQLNATNKDVWNNRLSEFEACIRSSVLS